MSCSTPFLEAFAHLQLPSGVIWPCHHEDDIGHWKKETLQRLECFNLAYQMNDFLQRYTSYGCRYDDKSGFSFLSQISGDFHHKLKLEKGEWRLNGMRLRSPYDVSSCVKQTVELIWKNILSRDRYRQYINMPQSDVTIQGNDLVWRHGYCMSYVDDTVTVLKRPNKPDERMGIRQAMLIIFLEITELEVKESYVL